MSFLLDRIEVKIKEIEEKAKVAPMNEEKMALFFVLAMLDGMIFALEFDKVSQTSEPIRDAWIKLMEQDITFTSLFMSIPEDTTSLLQQRLIDIKDKLQRARKRIETNGYK